jgi:hypothetical protein
MGLSSVVGLSYLPPGSYHEQEAHLPADEGKWSSGHQGKILGQAKEYPSQTECFYSQSYLGNRHDQDPDRRLGLVISDHCLRLVYQGNHRLPAVSTI